MSRLDISSEGDNTVHTADGSDNKDTSAAYDVLIQGTGLVESILASALAWQGSKVLHVDENSYYGGPFAALSIDELREWVVRIQNSEASSSDGIYRNPKLYIRRPLISRNYNIELSPRLLFAKSPLISTLVKSRVYQYLKFKPLGSFHTFENDSFEKVPSSKEDVFSNQSLSLITKRCLMKLLKFVFAYQSQPQVWKDYAQKPIGQFLAERFQLKPQQISDVVYSIGLCSNLETPTEIALNRIQTYLTSFEIFGNFPVLYAMYEGLGEVSQGFCRSAAVAGATYKLNTKVEKVSAEDHTALLSDGSTVKLTEAAILPQNQLSQKRILRMVVIAEKDCSEWFAEGESAAVVVFPAGSLGPNSQAVFAMVYGGGSGQVPEGQSIWYLASAEPGRQAADSLEKALKKLEDSILRESNTEFQIDVNDGDVMYSADGRPILSSVRLGQSLRDFVPKEKLNILLKLSYTEHITKQTELPPNAGTVTAADGGPTKVIKLSGLNDDIVLPDIIAKAKEIYAAITGSDDDFFDVDFEDDQEDTFVISGYSATRNGGGTTNGDNATHGGKNTQETVQNNDGFVYHQDGEDVILDTEPEPTFGHNMEL